MKLTKLIILSFLTLSVIGCGIEQPNEVLYVALEVEESASKSTDSNQTRSEIDSVANSDELLDSENEVRIELNDLRQQIIESPELSVGTTYENGVGDNDNLNFASNCEGDVGSIDQSGLAGGINLENGGGDVDSAPNCNGVVVDIDETSEEDEPIVEGSDNGEEIINDNEEELENNQEEPDLDSLDDHLRIGSVNSNGQEEEVDPSAENAQNSRVAPVEAGDEGSSNSSEYPDLTNQFDISDISVGDLFLYDETMCILTTVMTEIGPMPKVICTPLPGYDSTANKAPCFYKDQMYEHGSQWSDMEQVQVVIGVINGTPIYGLKLVEVVRECNNGEIKIIN